MTININSLFPFPFLFIANLLLGRILATTSYPFFTFPEPILLLGRDRITVKSVQKISVTWRLSEEVALTLTTAFCLHVIDRLRTCEELTNATVVRAGADKP